MNKLNEKIYGEFKLSQRSYNDSILNRHKNFLGAHSKQH